MFFLIDFDTRAVECISKDKKPLSDYIDKNKLSLAIAIIGSELDLTNLLSEDEIIDLYCNVVGGKKTKVIVISELTRKTWEALEDGFGSFPKYSVALGKKLIKAANRRGQDPIKDKKHRDKKPTSTNPQTKQAKRSSIVSILVLGIEPKVGTALGTMYKIVDDNLGEMKFSELVEEYMFNVEATEKLTRRYINKSIRLGHLEVKDETE